MPRFRAREACRAGRQQRGQGKGLVRDRGSEGLRGFVLRGGGKTGPGYARDFDLARFGRFWRPKNPFQFLPSGSATPTQRDARQPSRCAFFVGNAPPRPRRRQMVIAGRPGKGAVQRKGRVVGPRPNKCPAQHERRAGPFRFRRDAGHNSETGPGGAFFVSDSADASILGLLDRDGPEKKSCPIAEAMLSPAVLTRGWTMPENGSSRASEARPA